MTSVALLDACVLYPAPIRDLLMQPEHFPPKWAPVRRQKMRPSKSLSRQGLYQPRWSADIHDEWMRAVLRDRSDLTATQLSRTRALMDQHATGALVEGYQNIVSTLILPDGAIPTLATATSLPPRSLTGPHYS